MTECERFVQENKFPTSFFLPETRCDFLVDERRKKIWAIELDLWREFDRVCKKHDIAYFADYGTLLGAVRHEGFIPWDDDLDLCMTRENFEKLLKIGSLEFKKPYFLQTPYNDTRFFCPYARLRNSNTTGVVLWQKSPEYNSGIYLDLFVLDGYVGGKRFVIQRLIQKSIKKILCDSSVEYKTISARLARLLRPIAKCVGYHNIVRLYNYITCYYTGCRNSVLTLMTHNDQELKEGFIDIDDARDTISCPFEGFAMPIPKNYDKILKHRFGDYMSFPPVKERGVWHSNMIYFDPDVPYDDFYKSNNNLLG